MKIICPICGKHIPEALGDTTKHGQSVSRPEEYDYKPCHFECVYGEEEVENN